MIMMRVLLSFCLLAQLLTAVNCKSLRKVKSNAGKNEFNRKELRPFAMLKSLKSLHTSKVFF